jgi:CubicO group peptidase (beta-lactamase class C family)
VAAAVLASTHALEAQSPAPNAAATKVAVEQTIRSIFSLGATPGLGVAVVRDTSVVYVGGFGYADAEKRRPFDAQTPFYIASTTKAFTGLAAALLADSGRWSLDAPLSRYVPSMVLQRPLNPDSITIRSLLSHTHGIGNSGPVVTRLAYTGEYGGNAELIRLMRDHEPATTGRSYVYGNIGYNVAGLAMDAVTGTSWKETLRRMIFEPLGMRSTTAYASKVDTNRIAQPYRAAPTGFARRPRSKVDATMQSAGGLFTTPDDMTRWLLAQINKGRLGNRQVLSARAVAEAQKRQTSYSQTVSGLRYVGYSLGWQVALLGADTMLVHGGGFPGYATLVSFMPQRRAGVVVMANNSEFGGRLSQILASAIYETMRTGRPVSPEALSGIKSQLDRGREEFVAELERRKARSQVLPFPLRSYEGTYHNASHGRIVISRAGEKLRVRMGVAQSDVEVYDAKANQLRTELFGGGSVITVAMKGNRAASITHAGEVFQRVQ